MAIKTELVEGFIFTPDGTPVSEGFVRFRLSRYDTTANGVIAAAPRVDAPIEEDGSIAIPLWPNDVGDRGTFYRVSIYNRQGAEIEILGVIRVDAQPPVGDEEDDPVLDLADLLAEQDPGGQPSLYKVMTQAEYDAVIAAGGLAQSAAQSAATSEGNASDSAAGAATSAGDASDSAAAAEQDRIQTGLDRVQTGEDRAATAADRVQTGLDAQATAADRVATGEDKVATAADRVATAADRVQTGLDAARAEGALDHTLWVISDSPTGVTVGVGNHVVIQDPGPSPYGSIILEVA